MELLSPAGGREQLEAACAFGADAVYLAAEKFGMRARAANFSLDALPQAVEYAHAKGVKVYVTCNVTIMQDDLSELPAFLEEVDAAGADALIIGDLGAFALARKHAPHCRLHVSTQANIANSEAACMWHSLGASRIVCAREMTLSDIAKMRDEVPSDLEIEAFVHGAQCMAISGRCLISSYLTERSGNRGHCTQPCRWNYALEEEMRPGELFSIEEGPVTGSADGTFIMNAMDLNMLAHLAELEKAGVNSVKIEGRNKKAFYVATVTGAYRRAIDALHQEGESTESAQSDELISSLNEELDGVSHRPYSEGFYYGSPKQAIDYDGYEQQTIHIADVVSCVPKGESFELTVKCRNRFEEKDSLEALIPHSPTKYIVVKNLNWLPFSDEGTALAAQPVAVANRATELYSMEVEEFIPEGSFIRSRKHRRSARHL